MRIRTKAWTWVCSAVLAAGLLGVHHSDASAATTQTCGASAYRLSLQSLTGPPRADLTIRITTAMPELDGWDLAYLGVVEEARGRGIGREMTLKALFEAKTAEVRQLTLSVDESDMGRVIGRDGRIANAIRSLLRVMGTREGVHVELEIVPND